MGQRFKYTLKKITHVSNKKERERGICMRFVYLFKKQSVRHRGWSSICWFTPEAPTVTRTGPGQSREPGTPPCLPLGSGDPGTPVKIAGIPSDSSTCGGAMIPALR